MDTNEEKKVAPRRGTTRWYQARIAEIEAVNTSQRDTIQGDRRYIRALKELQSKITAAMGQGSCHLLPEQLPDAVKHLRERADRAVELEEKAVEMNQRAAEMERLNAGLTRQCACLRAEIDEITADRDRLQAQRDHARTAAELYKIERDALQSRSFWARLFNLGGTR